MNLESREFRRIFRADSLDFPDGSPIAGGIRAFALSRDRNKIGFLAPLTGEVAAWGLPGLYGCQIWAEKINKAGGIKAGGKSHLVEFVPYDNEYAPDKARAGAQKLINEDGVKFIMMLGGDTMPPVVDISNRTGMLVSTLLPSDLTPDTPNLIAPCEVHPIYNVTGLRILMDASVTGIAIDELEAYWIPEPTTLCLGLLGAVGMMGLARRRRFGRRTAPGETRFRREWRRLDPLRTFDEIVVVHGFSPSINRRNLCFDRWILTLTLLSVRPVVRAISLVFAPSSTSDTMIMSMSGSLAMAPRRKSMASSSESCPFG